MCVCSANCDESSDMELAKRKKNGFFLNRSADRIEHWLVETVQALHHMICVNEYSTLMVDYELVSFSGEKRRNRYFPIEKRNTDGCTTFKSKKPHVS